MRDLKVAKADKSEVDAAVAELLALKAAFKDLTGQDVPAPQKQSSKKDKKKPAAAAAAPAAAPATAAAAAPAAAGE